MVTQLLLFLDLLYKQPNSLTEQTNKNHMNKKRLRDQLKQDRVDFEDKIF